MHVLGRRFRQRLLLLVALHGCAVAYAEVCDPIVVVSDDAKFVVLDPATFAINDVGNLWWLEVRDVQDVIDGSKYRRAAFWSQSANSASVENNQMAREAVDADDVDAIDPRTPQLVVVENMRAAPVEDLLPPAVPGEALEKSDLRGKKVWWASGDPESESSGTLVAFGSEESSILLTALEPTLIVRDAFEIVDPTAGFGVACTDRDQHLLIAGLRNSYRFGHQGLESAEIVLAGSGSGGYSMTGVSNDCLAVLARFDPIDSDEAANSTVDLALVDLDRNQVLSRFASRRFVNRMLLSGGERIIEQRLDVQVLEAGGVVLQPTERVELIDTTSGQVIESVALPAAGALAGPFCGVSGVDTFVLQVDRTLYLVAGDDLQVVGQQIVPFERYFVF